jgi:hypothetical protein
VRRAYPLHTIEGYLARRDVPCPSCGYNLRGLAEGTCPECGFGFDVESLKALRTPRPLIIEWTIDHLFWAVVLLVCFNHGLATFTLAGGELGIVRLLSRALLLILIPLRIYADLPLDGKGYIWVERVEKVCALAALAQTLLVLKFLIL